MKHLYLALFYWSFTVSLFAGIGDLLPKPQQIKVNKEYFSLQNISLSTPVLEPEFVNLIRSFGGIVNSGSNHQIEVKLVSQLADGILNSDEAYLLSIKKNKVKIEALTTKGVYWAIQTLRQLHVAKGGKQYFEGCDIIDYPAFRVRGFMQDVGRSYISIDELKKEIATLSAYKINVFHWHLTEDLGWRLESKIFPMLNDSVNYGRMPGKFYTQGEAKDLVEYCKRHNVLLIPEIDMPGHSLAFRKAFRHDMQSEEGIKILKLLLDEVCQIFDVPYIHIGTDEVKFTNPDFVAQIVAHLRAKGKKVISWNPGWTYNPGEIDMTQLWSYRGKAQKGIPAIDSKFHYMNHYDAFADLFSLYNSRILNVNKGSEDHAGSILAFWHDRYIASEKDMIAQNGFYPAMLALAERSWLGGGNEYFDKLGVNIPVQENQILADFCDFARRLLLHKEKNFKSLPFAYVKQTNVMWRITDAFPNNGNLTAIFPPESKVDINYMYEGGSYQTNLARGATIYLRHVWGNLVPAFYASPQANHTAYAYTYVYSPKTQIVGLWLNFQNYSRSEMDLPPPQGKWDYKESRAWLNDEEIFPPVWESSHLTKSNEIALSNENFEVRRPIQVQLKKGWNKVLIKLPVGEFSSNQVRLVKWMFTCVFVTKDGQRAVEELIYSPDKIKQR